MEISLGVVKMHFKPTGTDTFTELPYTIKGENAKFNSKNEFVKHEVTEVNGTYEKKDNGTVTTITATFLKDDAVHALLANNLVENVDGTRDLINTTGSDAVEGILHVHPKAKGASTKHDLLCHRVLPEVEIDEDYNAEGKVVMKVTFELTEALDGPYQGHILKRGCDKDGNVNII